MHSASFVNSFTQLRKISWFWLQRLVTCECEPILRTMPGRNGNPTCVSDSFVSTLVQFRLILMRHNDIISGQSWWFRCNLDHWPLFKVTSGHRLSAIFSHNSLPRRDEEMWIVSLRSACRDASIDLHIDGYHLTLRPRCLRSNFDFDLSRSANAFFDASWR